MAGMVTTCIMAVMNKRAKKRLKEAVRKGIAETAGSRKEQGFNPPAKKLPQSRGFTPRPDKKRG
jgi:hypothetical protein